MTYCKDLEALRPKEKFLNFEKNTVYNFNDLNGFNVSIISLGLGWYEVGYYEDIKHFESDDFKHYHMMKLTDIYEILGFNMEVKK